MEKTKCSNILVAKWQAMAVHTKLKTGAQTKKVTTSYTVEYLLLHANETWCVSEECITY